VTRIDDILEFLGAGPDPVGGDAVEATIRGPGTIDAAGAAQVTFCVASAPRALERARSTNAGLAIVDSVLVDALADRRLPATVVVRSEHSRLDFARVVGHFFAASGPPAGVHPLQ